MQMELYLRKYFWVIWLVFIGLSAMFLAKATGQLVLSFVPQPKIRPQRLAPPPIAPSALRKTRNLGVVTDRNIFCADCVPQTPIDVAASSGRTPNSTAPVNGEPTRSSLDLKLVATLVSDDSAWSFAAIVDNSIGRSGLYAIGSAVPGNATITDIMERRILLENNGRHEYIDLEDQKEPTRTASAPKTRPEPRKPRHRRKIVPEDVASGIRQVGSTKWEIQRSALNKVRSNTTILARSARIVPSMRNGKPNGFRLYAIRKGSLYELLGLQNGDTINAVNGRPMTTPEVALDIYSKLSSASHFTIGFTRGAKQTTHDYVIR